MQIFRMVLKDKLKEFQNCTLDVTVAEGQSMMQFAQQIKSMGGFVNETVAVPYENILFVLLLDVVEPQGINAPAMGSA